MYKLAETFIKKESQWQAAAAPLGWTGAALGAGLGATAFGVSQFLKNPSNVKTLTDIPGNTWNGIKNFSNNIGNYVAPKKSTINSAPKPINWTNTAPSDVTSVNMYKKKNNSDAQVEQKISRASQGGTEPMPQTNPSKEPGKEPGRWDKFKNFANNHKWSFKYPLGLGVGTAATVLGYGGAHMFYDFANSDRTKILDKNVQDSYNNNMNKYDNVDKAFFQKDSIFKANEDSTFKYKKQLDSLRNVQE